MWYTTHKPLLFSECQKTVLSAYIFMFCGQSLFSSTFFSEYKNSKANIANSDEILVDSQVMSKVTTIHEENEKNGETNNVSDTNKQI